MLIVSTLPTDLVNLQLFPRMRFSTPVLIFSTSTYTIGKEKLGIPVNATKCRIIYELDQNTRSNEALRETRRTMTSKALHEHNVAAAQAKVINICYNKASIYLLKINSTGSLSYWFLRPEAMILLHPKATSCSHMVM